MLRLRVITALIVAPLVLGAIFLLSEGAYALVCLLIASAGAWEWGGLSGLTGTAGRLGFLAAFWLIVAALYFFAAPLAPALVVALVAWLLAVVLVLGYPAGSETLTLWVRRLMGLVVLVAAWAALVALKREQDGEWLVLWLLLLVWGADIGAYFAGHSFGRRKLAPDISPGKTWEGLFGGLAAAIGISVIAAAVTPAGIELRGMLPAAVLALTLGILAVFGDLFESVLKRVSGVKDSGGLLPGHGGALDRIDSLIAVLPLFALWVLLV